MRAWLFASVLLGSCGGDDAAVIDARVPDAEVPDAAFPSGTVTTEVMNFNVGFLQTVIGGAVRMPHIVDAVKASSAEIICFQELWHDQIATPAEFAAMVEDEYPYSAWDASTLTEFSPLSNGLLILSKHPLHRERFHRYTENDDIVDRAVIAATAVKGDEWTLHVVCTHLQAGLDGGDQDPPPANSNAAVRAAQLAELEDFVADNGYEDGPSVLLGDFNAGPDPDPTDAECPGGGGSCAVTCTPTDSITVANTVAAGWVDRADDLGFTECTYCMPEARDLEYIPLYPCEGSQRIDHCMTRGTAPSQITAIVRDMEQAIDEVIPGDAQDRHARTLSDHYAVRCTID